ncbi:unnamed protein product, partial [marine sediment metagenome]
MSLVASCFADRADTGMAFLCGIAVHYLTSLDDL